MIQFFSFRSHGSFMPYRSRCLRVSFCAALLVFTVAARAADPDSEVKPIRFLDLHSSLPADWQSVAPASSMRAAQVNVPGASPVELIVIYFGPGQGGPVDANVARWQGQFRPVGGKPVKPALDKFTTAGGFGVDWVELRGDYARGVGMGPVGDYRHDQMLIAAIMGTPRGNLYIQFHGDTDVVLMHWAAFREFVAGLRPLAQP